MDTYLTEYSQLIIIEFKLVKWSKLYEEIETNYRSNAVLAIENKQVNTNKISNDYDAIINGFNVLSDIIAIGIDALLKNRDNEKKFYDIIKNVSNTLIKHQKDDYVYNMNEIEVIMTNLDSMLGDLERLLENIKTNYNNAFMSLNKDEQQKYKDILVDLMMLKSTEIMIELYFTQSHDEAISMINNISTKIFTYTDKLLENGIVESE